MAHDQATLDDLLAHAEWMRDLAWRLLGDRDEAEDVVQDAWLNALRVPPTRGRTLRPWIATVVLNLVRSRLRRGVRSRAREEHFGSPDPVPAAEEMLAQRQTERLLAQLVLALDEPYRRTILLRFHDGHSSAAIARDEGIPEGTVRWRLKYGLDELRRRFSKSEDGGNARNGQKALGALVALAWPLGGPNASALAAPSAAPLLAPAPVAVASPWLAPVALLQGKAVLTAVGAVAAVAAVTVGVRPHRHKPRAVAPVAHVASVSSVRKTSGSLASSPLLPPGLPAPLLVPAVTDPPPSDVPSTTTASAVPPGPAKLTAITGIVRDSRGQAAARVPVTLRRLTGSGAADRTTITDDEGRFSYQLQSNSSFVLTAELQGEPAARLEIAVPSRLTLSLDAAPSLTSQAASFATIDVALDVPARRTFGRPARRRPAAGVPASRWCCHQAFEGEGVVYGRACLKFDDSRRSDQSGCELYRLKAQVSCQHRIRGGLSTGDLSRTEHLHCDGRVL